MAKAVFQNWITSALGVGVVLVQLYSAVSHGNPIDPSSIACGIGLLMAKDGG